MPADKPEDFPVVAIGVDARRPLSGLAEPSLLATGTRSLGEIERELTDAPQPAVDSIQRRLGAARKRAIWSAKER